MFNKDHYNMPVEKKRPRGLKGSAMAKANKKTKVQEPSSSTEMPENAQTVVLDKVVEEGDEVGEAAALYESAIEKLGNFFFFLKKKHEKKKTNIVLFFFLL